MFGTKKKSKSGGLFGGLIAGAGLLLAAVLVLFWNEGRAVKRAAVLAEGKAAVQQVDAARVEAGNEGRLLHVRGELAVAGPLADPDFGVAADGLALRRRVEMFQWEEKKSRKSGDSQTYEYRYETAWSDRLVDHTGFDQPQGHENPAAMPFSDGLWRADEVRLGGFALGREAQDELRRWESIAPDPARLPANLAASLRAEAGVLTTAESLSTPKVGDIRIRFDYVPLGFVSVVAAQRGAALEPYAAKRGELLLAERGSSSVQAMFDSAASANSRLGWTLRTGGFFAFWVGFGLMLKPIGGALGRLPVIGAIGRFVTTAVSFLLAASLSLLTIVSGWLFHRPWLLGLILIALAAGIVWLSRRPRATARAPVPAAPAGPPPPPASPPPPPPPTA